MPYLVAEYLRQMLYCMKCTSPPTAITQITNNINVTTFTLYGEKKLYRACCYSLTELFFYNFIETPEEYNNVIKTYNTKQETY